MEPTKHQYDYDSATVYGFLVRNGLEGEYARQRRGQPRDAGRPLASTTRSRSRPRTAFLGSIDANRGDPQNGWDTDQFPNSVEDLTMPIYEILRAGGIAPGGFNFDAKLRRQSTDRTDLFHAHIGGTRHAGPGAPRRGRADRGRRAGRPARRRYAGWDGDLGTAILDGAARPRGPRGAGRLGRDRPAPGVGRARSASRTWSTRRSGRSAGTGRSQPPGHRLDRSPERACPKSGHAIAIAQPRSSMTSLSLSVTSSGLLAQDDHAQHLVRR